MACVLTTGRTEPCSDAIGGIKKLYLADFLEDSFTITAGEATAMNIALTAAYEFELLNDGNSVVETFTEDRNAGTSVYEQVVTVALKKQDKATANELALIVKARPIAIVLDRMDNYRIYGISDGTVASGDIQSGGAKIEFNGYNLTLTATEVLPAPTLDSATETAFLAVVSATQINP